MRYTDAINPTWVELMSSVSGWIRTPVTELAIVICSPSRIHAAPRPATMRVWNGDQLRRSSRAGIVLLIVFPAASTVLIGLSFVDVSSSRLPSAALLLRQQLG